MRSPEFYKQQYYLYYRNILKKTKARIQTVYSMNIDRAQRKNRLNHVSRQFYIMKSKLKHYFNIKIITSIRYHKQRSSILNNRLRLSSTHNKKSFLIGINYFRSKYQLNGCINDVHNMANRLYKTGFKNTIFTDRNTYKPTFNNIINQFVHFLKSANPGDILFFMFSGHGSYIRDRSGDETDGKDEVIIGSDFRAIKDDILKKIIERYLKPTVTLIALFDSCHSGTILDLKYKYLDTENYNSDTVDTLQRETRANVICLSSSLDSQISIDAAVGNTYGGAMTTAVLNVLSKNNNISWRSLIQKIRDILLHQNNRKQTPQISSGRPNFIDQNICI